MPFETLSSYLGKCDCGKIFLLQAARSILQVEEISTRAKAELKGFLESCERKVEEADSCVNVERRFFFDGVYNYPDRYFLDCEHVLREDNRLVTVLTYDQLHMFLNWNKDNPGKPPPGEPERRKKIRSLNSGTGPGRAFPDGVSLGTAKGTSKNIVWVTNFETARFLAPELSTEIDALGQGSCKRIRDFLGLRHLRGGDDMVLAILREGAVGRHLRKPEAKAARPFLFEGGANPRFHLYSRNRTEPGWNRAFNLQSVEDASVPIDGAPESVLSAVTCDEIERLIWLGSPGTPPCAGRSADVVSRMQRTVDLDQAKSILESFD